MQSIPLDLKQIYRDCIYSLPRQKAALILKKEISDLTHQESLVQYALKNVKIREEILNNLKKMNDRLTSGKMTQNNVYTEAVSILEEYREITFNTFECIMNWKQQMRSILVMNSGNVAKSDVQFCINGDNYLKKLKEDFNFLRSSGFSSFIMFSNKLDVFLIDSAKNTPSPGKKVRRLPSSGYKQIIPIPEDQLEKYENARIALDQEEDSKLEGILNLTSVSSVAPVAISGYSTVIQTVRAGIDARTHNIHILEEKENRGNAVEIRDNSPMSVAASIETHETNNRRNRVKSIDSDANLRKSRQGRKSASKQHGRNSEIPSIRKNVTNKASDLNRPQSINQISIKNVTIIESTTHMNLKEDRHHQNIGITPINSTPKAKLNPDTLPKDVTTIPESISKQDDFTKPTVNSLVEHISKALSHNGVSINNPFYSIFGPLFLNDISSSIYRNLIETMIDQEDLESMVEQNISSEISYYRSKSHRNHKSLLSIEKHFESEKLANLLYISLLQDCIDSFDLLSLSQSCIKSYKLTLDRRLTISSILKHIPLDQIDTEIDLYTPGAHSPNFYSPNRRLTYIFTDNSTPCSSSCISERTIETDQISPEKSNRAMRVKPVNLKECEVEGMLEEYYRRIDDGIGKYVGKREGIIKEAFEGWDPVWLYVGREEIAEGLLVFSKDCVSKVERKINIHHLSSINWNMYETVLQSAIEYIFSHFPCDQITLRVHNSPINLAKNVVIDALKAKEFKLTTYIQTLSHSQCIQIFTLKRISTSISLSISGSFFSSVLIKGFTILSLSKIAKSLNRSTEGMYKIGNRNNLLNSILPIYSESSDEFFQRYTVNSLQEDLHDMIEIVSATEVIYIQSFKYPYMKYIKSSSASEVLSFVQNSEIRLKEQIDISYTASVLDLSFRLIGGMAIEHSVASKRYRYIRFRHPQIYSYKSYDRDIYILPTSSRTLSLLFIHYKNLKQELQLETKKCRSDLFSKVESILSQIQSSPVLIPEIYIPAFSKSVTSEMPWIQGLKLSTMSVNNCTENLSICIDIPKPSIGLLKPTRFKFPVLREDFIFGVISSPLSAKLDLPLLVCLVEREDLILV